MDNLYLAEIILFAGNFAPKNTAYCNGQILSIAQNQALFSLLGTTYGGDGRTSFALPDLRGRVPVHPGTGPGLTTRKLGQRAGTETNTLTVAQMPAHNHLATGTIKASNAEGTTNTPTNGVPAKPYYQVDRATKAPINMYAPAANAKMADNGVPITVGHSGGGLQANNMQPFLGVSYIICMNGLFPSRN